MLKTTLNGLAPCLAAPPHAATNDEAGNRANGSGPKDQEIRPMDSPTATCSAQADKPFETARARAALARGFQLHQVLRADGTGHEYLIARWNYSTTLPSIAAVNDFLDRVGAPR